KRVTYKTEQRCEKYTAYKCETYTECCERTVTRNRRVTEWVDQCKTVCVRVPVCEERTVCRPCYRYVTETKMVTRCVDKGHWECREEYSHWKAFCNGLSGLCQRHNDCCDPCGQQGCGQQGCGQQGCGQQGCGQQQCCQQQCQNNCVQRRVWVPCMVQEQCPVTCCRKVCEMKTEVCKVTTYRTEQRQVNCKVCVVRCIPETCVVKENVCKTRQGPHEYTRNVCGGGPCAWTGP